MSVRRNTSTYIRERAKCGNFLELANFSKVGGQKGWKVRCWKANFGATPRSQEGYFWVKKGVLFLIINDRATKEA